jgi:hypothetical protein
LAVILRINLDDSTAGVRREHCELGASFPKSSLEIVYGFSTPDPNELGPTTRVSQEHLASEKRLELFPPNVALNEASLAVDVTPFASL